MDKVQDVGIKFGSRDAEKSPSSRRTEAKSDLRNEEIHQDEEDGVTWGRRDRKLCAGSKESYGRCLQAQIDETQMMKDDINWEEAEGKDKWLSEKDKKDSEKQITDVEKTKALEDLAKRDLRDEEMYQVQEVGVKFWSTDTEASQKSHRTQAKRDLRNEEIHQDEEDGIAWGRTDRRSSTESPESYRRCLRAQIEEKQMMKKEQKDIDQKDAEGHDKLLCEEGN